LKQDKETKTRRREYDTHIDFDLSIKEKMSDVFGISLASTKKKDLLVDSVKLDREFRTTFLLPKDMHIRPSRLTNLFSRKTDYQNLARFIKQEHTENFKAGNDYEDLALIDIQNFGNHHDDPISLEYQTNLNTIFNATTNTKPFEKSDKAINIKVLKESMWNFMSDKVEAVNLNEEAPIAENNNNSQRRKSVDNKTMRFTDICENVTDIMGLGKPKSLSIHSCFVTVLHLANEKGLRFCKEGEDFLIYKEHSY